MNPFKNTLNFLTIIFFSFLCIVFQSTLLHQFFGLYKPNLLVILIAYLALNRFTIEGGILSFIIGYVMELNSGAPFGLYSCVCVMTYMLTKVLCQGLLMDVMLSQMGLVVLSSLIFKLSFWGVLSIYQPLRETFVASILSLFVMAFLNFLLTPIVFFSLALWDALMSKERPTWQPL